MGPSSVTSHSAARESMNQLYAQPAGPRPLASASTECTTVTPDDSESISVYGVIGHEGGGWRPAAATRGCVYLCNGLGKGGKAD